VLVASVIVALTSNRLIFGNVARYVGPGARRNV
jgi:SSS family solute:Na+ symporter